VTLSSSSSRRVACPSRPSSLDRIVDHVTVLERCRAPVRLIRACTPCPLAHTHTHTTHIRAYICIYIYRRARCHALGLGSRARDKTAQAGKQAASEHARTAVRRSRRSQDRASCRGDPIRPEHGTVSRSLRRHRSSLSRSATVGHVQARSASECVHAGRRIES
jgi:hypothetical protein